MHNPSSCLSGKNMNKSKESFSSVCLSSHPIKSQTFQYHYCGGIGVAACYYCYFWLLLFLLSLLVVIVVITVIVITTFTVILLL